MPTARTTDRLATQRFNEGVGLCAQCAQAKTIRSHRGSTFYLCLRSVVDGAFQRYPVLPVRMCTGYESREQRARVDTFSGVR